MTIKNPVTAVLNTVAAIRYIKREAEYEFMIEQSKAKLELTKHVPGYTNIYA
jgi:hypothetical protein